MSATQTETIQEGVNLQSPGSNTTSEMLCADYLGEELPAIWDGEKECFVCKPNIAEINPSGESKIDSEFPRCRRVMPKEPKQVDTKNLSAASLKDNQSRNKEQDQLENKDKPKRLDFFEKFLPLWIAICMTIGIVLSITIPGLNTSLEKLKVGDTNILIGVCLFILMYPALLNLDLKQLKNVAKHPKPILISLFANWVIAPFLNAGLGYGILSKYPQLIVSIILLGSSPCTAMVIVWGYLSDANQEQNIITTSLNTVTIIFAYAPLVKLLANLSYIELDFVSLLVSVGIFIGIPLILGLVSKRIFIRVKGQVWFDTKYKAAIGKISIVSLLLTLVILFSMNGQTMIDHPQELLLMSGVLLLSYCIIVVINIIMARIFKLKYKEAATTILIGSSSHFEIAIATAIGMYGINSQAALGTTMGLFWEVPTMMALVKILQKLREKKFFALDAK